MLLPPGGLRTRRKIARCFRERRSLLIARATLKPRRMTARSFDGVFVAHWSDPTPLEQEITWHRMVDVVNAAQPKNWQERRDERP
jgi:hypothetical protein